MNNIHNIYLIYLGYIYYTLIMFPDIKRKQLIANINYTLYDIIKYLIVIIGIINIGYITNYIDNDNIIIKNIFEIDVILSIFIYFHIDNVWEYYKDTNKKNYLYILYYITVFNISIKLIDLNI